MVRKSIIAIAACISITSSGLAAERGSRQPNILFAIADDASWPHFSAYGCKFIHTPAFDRIARDGIIFNNCFTPTPKCSPSRACLLTGRYPWQVEEAADHFGVFSARFKVYPDLLEDAGYFVGFTGKGWGPGNFVKGGFHRNPAGPAFNRLKNKPPTKDISPIDYAANFSAFLAERPEGKPFCFWYGGHEPHRPYELGSGLRSGKKLSDVTLPPYYLDSDVIRSDMLDYAFEIEWFDRHLGLMLKKLEEIGELDNTLVVVTSDNGMPFPRDKGHMFEDACHMPLAIRWKGVVTRGRTADDFISFTDFAPTFLEATGLKPHEQMSGHSFMNVLKAETSGQVDPSRDHVILGRERTDLSRPNGEGYPVRCIRTQDYWYSLNFKPDRWPCGNPELGYLDTDESPTKSLIVRHAEDRYWQLSMGKRPGEELYDLRKDPGCVNNIAADPALARVKKDLCERLENALREQKDPRILGQGDVFDRYQYEGPNPQKPAAVPKDHARHAG